MAPSMYSALSEDAAIDEQALDPRRFSARAVQRLRATLPRTRIEHEMTDWNLCNSDVHSNLGGLGPDTGELGIRHRNVASALGGKAVDLFISNVTHYSAHEAHLNGHDQKSPCLGIINLDHCTNVTLEAKFLISGTNTPVELDMFAFTVYDVDKSSSSEFRLQLPRDMTSYFVDEDTSLRVIGDDPLEFRASMVGTDDDNPASATELTSLQMARTVAFQYAGRSGFTFTIALDGGHRGRNIIFAGSSPLLAQEHRQNIGTTSSFLPLAPEYRQDLGTTSVPKRAPMEAFPETTRSPHDTTLPPPPPAPMPQSAFLPLLTPLPTTVFPTPAPTESPTWPTPEPTSEPTPQPTRVITIEPTTSPTSQPTHVPTLEPTPMPTAVPTLMPTPVPTPMPPPPTASPTLALEPDRTDLTTAAPMTPSPTETPTASLSDEVDKYYETVKRDANIALRGTGYGPVGMIIPSGPVTGASQGTGARTINNVNIDVNGNWIVAESGLEDPLEDLVWLSDRLAAPIKERDRWKLGLSPMPPVDPTTTTPMASTTETSSV